MELRSISIEQLEQNTGQVDGLPKNPRQWTRSEFDNLTKSIHETPELLEVRGLIVARIAEDRYVVLGGNMRLDACRKLGYTEMPCFVLPDDTPVDKLKEIVIKDNGSFGGWDWDAIANEWDVDELKDWGFDASLLFGAEDENLDLDLKNTEDECVKSSPGSDEFQMTLLFPSTERDNIERYIKSNGKAPIVDCVVALVNNVTE